MLCGCLWCFHLARAACPGLEREQTLVSMPESSSFAPLVGCCGPELGPASLVCWGP